MLAQANKCQELTASAEAVLIQDMKTKEDMQFLQEIRRQLVDLDCYTEDIKNPSQSSNAMQTAKRIYKLMNEMVAQKNTGCFALIDQAEELLNIEYSTEALLAKEHNQSKENVINLFAAVDALKTNECETMDDYEGRLRLGAIQNGASSKLVKKILEGFKKQKFLEKKELEELNLKKQELNSEQETLPFWTNKLLAIIPASGFVALPPLWFWYNFSRFATVI